MARVVYFPPDFNARIDEFRESLQTDAPSPEVESVDDRAVPSPQIYFNTAKDRSRIAYDRLAEALRQWREELVQRNLEVRQIPVEATQPFIVANHDVAEETTKRAVLWSKILPFVVLVWALTGAFYPAIDLCAGEKERGTLETLLCSPAARSEIVWGKLLTVMTFSVATSLLNLLSMVGTGTFVISQLERAGALGGASIGAPPLLAMVWLLVALIPIAALFSALSLAVAAFARSSKEGQYYLMPLLMISLPLMMLPLLPSSEIDLGSSLIPISGAMLLLRTLIEGDYARALPFAIPVIGVTALCCHLAIRWAVDQFNNESVIFRETERFGIAAWFKHMVRDRGDTPTIAEALFCGMILLMLRFFGSMASTSVPTSFGGFASVVLITQVALIAAPVLLMAIMLTRKPRKTLSLSLPHGATIPAAICLAVAAHPLAMLLSYLVQLLYPMSPETLAQLQGLDSLILDSPSIWLTLGVIALAPAICEELAFRGFILSGLRHSGHKWMAIIGSSLFFGAVHGILQQSISACVLGVVLGYIAVQTGSLLPCIGYHLTHNSLTVLLASASPELVADWPVLSWLIQVEGEGVGYTWYAMAAGGVLVAGLLYWFHSLHYQQTAEEQLQEALDHQALPSVK